MLPIVGQIFLSIAFNLVSSFLVSAAQPKPKKPEPGKMELPKAAEGGGIKVIYGTILIKDPLLAWWGGQYTIPIRSKGGKK